MKTLYIMILFIISSTYGTEIFTRNDSFNFTEAHELYAAPNYNRCPGTVTIKMSRPFDFAENFTITIKKSQFFIQNLGGHGCAPGNYSLEEYKLDYNNDGNWDTGWIDDSERTFTYDYPDPSDWGSTQSLRLKLKYAAIDGTVPDETKSINFELYPNAAVYEGDQGNVFVGIQKDVDVTDKKPIL